MLDPSSIIFEDQELIALNKPAGLHSVDNPKSSNPSLAGWLKNERPEMQTASKSLFDCGLVQRLDFETSGLILGAKNRETWELWHKAFCAGQVKKSYIALCSGILKKDVTLNGFIGQRHRGSNAVEWSDRKKLRYVAATCRIVPLLLHKPKEQYTFVRVDLTHAVRHQVRLCCAKIGHPLVGDRLYGLSDTLPESLPKFLLHAYSLSCKLPGKPKAIELQAEVPLYFQDLGWKVSDAL